MSHSKLVRWYRTAARVAAWIAGANPLDVWPTYETWSEDSGRLFDTAEDLYNSVKWILEERERERERSNATSPTASSVVPITDSSGLDHEGTEKV